MENTTPMTFILGVLGAVLIVLKLIGMIDIGWWLIFLPWYGPLIAWAGIISIVFLFALLANWVDQYRERSKNVD